MKVMMREIMRFLPGKMGEGMKLLEESLTMASKKYGPLPSMRKYTPWFGGGNAIHTVVLEFEWDSLAQMSEFYEKAMTDQEMMGTMTKWETVEESHETELYGVMP